MSFATRLLRTSRALRTQHINPIQSALNTRGQQQLVRGYATVFERSKPHVNIGTIGHVDHGKVRRRLKSRKQWHMCLSWTGGKLDAL